MKRKNIIIVDDNEDIVDSIILGIDHFNPSYNFLKASNGKQALEIIREKTPDLVILDLMMPVMDGFETSSIMKKDKELKNIPILFLSAKTDMKIKNLIMKSGDDYSEKPFDLKELNIKIKRLLSKTKD